jgi:transposase
MILTIYLMKTIPPRHVLESAYKQEKDSDTSTRILLVLKVAYDNMIPAQASRHLDRSRPWATKWLRRFRKNGIEGLYDGKRSGRPPKLDQKAMSTIKRKVKSSRSGWTMTEVRDVIREEGGAIYSERQVYRLLHSWDMRPIVPEKRLASKASREERLAFKKTMHGSSAAYQRDSR